MEIRHLPPSRRWCSPECADHPQHPARARRAVPQALGRRSIESCKKFSSEEDKLTDMELSMTASVRYCADGGANRLYDAYRSKEPSQAARTNRDDPTTIHHDDDDDGDDMIPDLIKGDLDSLRDDVRAYYESKNVSIVHDPDQYSTDLGKCVVALTEYETKLATQAIPSTFNEPAPLRTPIQHQLVIVGGLSGRLDQTIHTLHALTLLDQEREMTWAVGQESLACVLGQGTHDISTNLKYFGDTCGILPVGEPAKVTTSGLKWDLTPTTFAYPTSIAAGVSSSNVLPQESITVTTDVPVVWTVEVRSTTRP